MIDEANAERAVSVLIQHATNDGFKKVCRDLRKFGASWRTILAAAPQVLAGETLAEVLADTTTMRAR